MPPRRGTRGGRNRGSLMSSMPRTQPKQSDHTKRSAPRALPKPICTCFGPQQFKHINGHSVSIDCDSVPHNAFLTLPCSKLGSLCLPPPLPFLSGLSKESHTDNISKGDRIDDSSQSQPGHDTVPKYSVNVNPASIPNTTFTRLQKNETPQSLHQKFIQTQTPDNSRNTRVQRLSLRPQQPSPSPSVSTPETPIFSPITPNRSSFGHEVRSIRSPRPHLRQSSLSRLQVVPDNPAKKAEIHRKMAPVRDPNSVQGSIKEVIQNLYDVQNQVHGYVPETQAVLVDKMTELAESLSHLQKLTNETSSPNNPIHGVHIAPEIIDYVDDGRNPDIYTRDFVELVQRGNSVMNGKQQAFRGFSEIFAQVLKDRLPQLSEHVDQVMENGRTKVPKQAGQEERRNGKNGTNAS